MGAASDRNKSAMVFIGDRAQQTALVVIQVALKSFAATAYVMNFVTKKNSDGIHQTVGCVIYSTIYTHDAL